MHGAANRRSGDDLHRGCLSRTEQQRPVGAALDLWSDLSTLAANPNQAGAQQTVAADANGLAEALNNTSTQLSDLSASVQSKVGTGSADSGTLAQANALLSQVAQLNQGIVAGDSASQNVNALSDERRSAVDQLAGLLGISTSTAPSGALTIIPEACSWCPETLRSP